MVSEDRAARVRVKRNIKPRLNRSDLVFHWIARVGGSMMLVTMLLIGAFLAFRAAQALHTAG